MKYGRIGRWADTPLIQMADVLAVALAITILCSAKDRRWQEGTVVYAERQKEAPAPSDAVAVTDSENAVRTVINRHRKADRIAGTTAVGKVLDLCSGQLDGSGT